MSKYDSHLKCSFCGKSQEQVRKLIAGPGVYICDECVDLCNEILDEELFDTGTAVAQPVPRREMAAPERSRSTAAPISMSQIPKPKEMLAARKQNIKKDNMPNRMLLLSQ